MDAEPTLTGYVIMKHDPDGKNHEYLYWYATVKETVRKGDYAVDIVEVTGEGKAELAFRIASTFARLWSGSETAFNQPCVTLAEAHYYAQEVLGLHGRRNWAPPSCQQATTEEGTDGR